MPNFEPDHCLEHSIYNDKKNVHWLERDDTHCWCGKVCCWCGRKLPPDDTKHGPYKNKGKA